LTVPLVKAFRLLLPNARLATVEGLSVYMLEWLSIGRVDCALVYNAPASPTLDLQPLLDEQLFFITPLVCPRKRTTRKSITLSELSEHPLIIPSRPHAIRMSVENALSGIDRKIRVAHEIECIPAVIDLVREGLGSGVLPLSAMQATQGGNAVEVKPIVAPVLKTSLSIVISAQRPKSPLMRKSLELIRDIVRQEISPAEVPV
jgi:LysR family transcriptional regulator, nitrogen assimilation regulatory protein